MILTGANSQLVYQSALVAPSTVWWSCQQRHLCCSPQYWLVSCHPRHLWSKWEVAEGNENSVYPSLWDFKRSFTCRKILRHGTSGFSSHLKEGVLKIFITLKNSSPWPSKNPQPLGPVASTLTTKTTVILDTKKYANIVKVSFQQDVKVQYGNHVKCILSI
jgi:hypothetical protein